MNPVVRVEESLDDILKLTTKSIKEKPASKKMLSTSKPGGHVNKAVTTKTQETTKVDEMDTADISRYIEQENNADSDVDLFS